MAIKYKVIKQPPNKLSTTGKPSYNARACERSRVSLDEISEIIQRNSSLSKADVYSTLISLTDIIPDFLLNNQSVDLGKLGTISLHLSSHSEDQPEDVTWRSIKELKVQFRAGKELKKELKKAHFKRVD
ncbi:HU family DNA-binding protein [Carboxylicivirga marina]|uniref:HU family DNA-binding protein n=1 Tax=Carboxylicivirga marina TaxID=2800988 RepID=UPI00259A7A3F|nr:HU family DNA-binding protein [uncultured Carboxylicivirga sp.]